ncbi:YlbF family regulator, partial [Bacillus sp. D-CC]
VETALQKLLDEVSVAIGSEVSSSIKVPTGNPFFDAGGCGGGCGTGGGCGCKKTG